MAIHPLDHVLRARGPSPGLPYRGSTAPLIERLQPRRAVGVRNIFLVSVPRSLGRAYESRTGFPAASSTGFEKPAAMLMRSSSLRKSVIMASPPPHEPRKEQPAAALHHAPIRVTATIGTLVASTAWQSLGDQSERP